MTNRADLARRLSLSPNSPTKTFVLEVHASEPTEYLRDLVGAANVEPTEDAFLFQVYLPGGSLWVDQLDERFWSLHTDLPANEVGRFLHERVESRRELDWI